MQCLLRGLAHQSSQEDLALGFPEEPGDVDAEATAHEPAAPVAAERVQSGATLPVPEAAPGALAERQDTLRNDPTP